MPSTVWTRFQRAMKRVRLRLPTQMFTYPFELAFAAIFLVVGVNLLVSFDQTKISATDFLPAPLAILWGACLTLSGPLMLAAIFWRGSETMARAVEGAGLFLAMSAWASYAVIINTLAHGKAASSVWQAVIIVLACILRGWALYSTEKAIDKANHRKGERNG